LAAALHALAFIGWPLAFIIAGLLLLARSRTHRSVAVPPPAASATVTPAVPTPAAYVPAAQPNGPTASAAGASDSGSRLYRSRTNRIVGGVIAGAAQHLGVSVDLARLAFVIATLLTGFWPGVIVYAIALSSCLRSRCRSSRLRRRCLARRRPRSRQ